MVTILYAWDGAAELQYSVKLNTEVASTFPESSKFHDCWMEWSIRYHFFIDLESIQHKLLSDYSLNMFLAPFSLC